MICRSTEYGGERIQSLLNHAIIPFSMARMYPPTSFESTLVGEIDTKRTTYEYCEITFVCMGHEDA